MEEAKNDPADVCRRTGEPLPGLQHPRGVAAAPRSGFYAVSRINNRVVPRGIDRTGGQRLQRVADAVANILRPVRVGGSGGLRHQNADESRRDGLIRKLQMDIPAAAVRHRAR